MMSAKLQPEASPATTQIAGRAAAEFRPGIALAFCAGVFVCGAIALSEHGIGSVVFAAIGVAAAGIALRRLRQERALLEDRATTIATVTHWEESEASDGGRSYAVKYRFLGPNGKEYLGKETSQVELPRKGELLPVSYLRDDPTQNLPLATFWFYRFTYTGFAGWME
jgi:hypothetical protein